MKIRIAVLIALGTILPVQHSFSDTVDVTKIKTFVKGKAAVAAEVNGNFTETTRAINDNYTKLQSVGGDGSGNTLSIANNVDWSGKNLDGSTKSPKNLNWSSCRFAGAITVIIPSGVTLRCKTGFILGAAATIVVKQGYGAGVATEQPTVRNNGVAGAGGMPAEEAAIRSSTNFIPLGGAGPTSGGYLRIQSDGEISIQGTIKSDGGIGSLGSRTGGGGGAGGIIVLQSSVNITLSGTVQANGGNGAAAQVLTGKNIGPSGGGGGGIIVMHAPVISISSTSTRTVNPGDVGTNPPITVNAFSFGDGGYASGGKGGEGDNLASGPTRPVPGGLGLLIDITGIPATMVP